MPTELAQINLCVDLGIYGTGTFIECTNNLHPLDMTEIAIRLLAQMSFGIFILEYLFQ